MTEMTKEKARLIGWGLIGEPTDGVLVSGPSGPSLEVYGYNETDYWDDSGKFLGPDCYGIVPIYELPDGTVFPADAVPYPTLC